MRTRSRPGSQLSSGYARADSPASVLRVHAEIEDHLTASGVPHTLISPASFMEILFLAAPQIRGTGGWSGASGDGTNALIDSQDVVDSVLEVVLHPAKGGRTYVLTGSEAFTWGEVAARLADVVGRRIVYRGVTLADRAAELSAAGLDPWRVELLIGLDEVNRNAIYAAPTTDFRELTGKESRGLDAFLDAHRAVFESTG